MSRPRPSLLALFDPLSQSTSTVNRDASTPSPDSGSDKENVNTTTPRTSRQSDASFSETQFFQRTISRSKQTDIQGQIRDLPPDSIGKSFTLGSDSDSSNLCLVQLADELESVCKIKDENLDRGSGPREPLSEISLVTNNIATPNFGAEKKLINLDTPRSSSKSILKFATGVTNSDLPTPSPLVGISQEARSSIPHITSPSITISSHTTPYLAPAIPFSSQSLEERCSVTTPQSRSPQFQDPPSGFLGSSFEVQSSFEIKKIDLSGDLLNDELSFLERLDDDSFTDVAHLKPLGKSISSGTDFTANGRVLKSKRLSIVESRLSLTKGELPPPDLSVDDLEDDCVGMGPSSNILLQTPPSSPISTGSDIRARVLAPKKSIAVIRGANEEKKTASAMMKRTGSLKPRDSIGELKPLAVRKRAQAPMATTVASTASAPVRRPLLARRSSISTDLMKSRTSLESSTNQVPSQTLTQKRLSFSMSTSAKAATTGRVGGARRVPLTADAPFFKESKIAESSEKRSLASSVRSGPQRPSIPTSLRTGANTLSRSTTLPSKPLVRSTSASTTTIPRPSIAGTSSNLSRLPMPHTKTLGSGKLPGPGFRKAL